MVYNYNTLDRTIQMAGWGIAIVAGNQFPSSHHDNWFKQYKFDLIFIRTYDMTLRGEANCPHILKNLDFLKIFTIGMNNLNALNVNR